MPNPIGPIDAAYQAALQKNAYAPDAAQQKAIATLESFAHHQAAFWQTQGQPGQRGGWAVWRAYWRRFFPSLAGGPPSAPQPQGVYLHGGVGRGKTFVMDVFFHAVPLPPQAKARWHFHAFMQAVHQDLAARQGQTNPLEALAGETAARHRLLCLDELHINDVGDALVLERLLQALFQKGVGLVATSNFHPEGLYPNGLNRSRVLPLIALLKARTQVLALDAGVDYRRAPLPKLTPPPQPHAPHVPNTSGTATHPAYHWPLGEAAEQAMAASWMQLTGVTAEEMAQALAHPTPLHIAGRAIQVRCQTPGVVWLTFEALCNTPRSPGDYLEISQQFHTLLLSGVPQLSADMALPARRLAWLVDVLYDRQVKLVVSAQVPPDALYTQGPLAPEFARTASRLFEMQSPSYWERGLREIQEGTLV